MYNTEYQNHLIQAGKSKIKELQKNHYLHNAKQHYEKISDFEPVDITIMDSIMDRIIKKQKSREKEALRLLGFKNIEELNKYFSSEINLNLINSKIEDILYKAANNLDIEGKDVKTKKQLEKEAVRVLDSLIEEPLQNERAIKILKETMGSHIANFFKATRKKPDTNKFIQDVGKSWGNEWRKAVLEESITAIVNSLLYDLKKTNLKISTTGADTRTSGKTGLSVKADNTIQDFETGLTFGISAKNYSFLTKGSGEVTLHSPESLKNFYDLIEDSTPTDRISVREMKALAKKFQKNDFIYHLINSAAHQGGKTNRQGGKALYSSPADNLVSFVKKCLPLFMGTQLRIKGNEVNVDFLNINGTFVPTSTILENIFFVERKKKGNLFGNRISLYSNSLIDWDTMLLEKKNNNSKNFYSQATQKVGSYYGNETYNKMRLGRMHLRVALSKLK